MESRGLNITPGFYFLNFWPGSRAVLVANGGFHSWLKSLSSHMPRSLALGTSQSLLTQLLALSMLLSEKTSMEQHESTGLGGGRGEEPMGPGAELAWVPTGPVASCGLLHAVLTWLGSCTNSWGSFHSLGVLLVRWFSGWPLHCSHCRVGPGRCELIRGLREFGSLWSTWSQGHTADTVNLPDQGSKTLLFAGLQLDTAAGLLCSWPEGFLGRKTLPLFIPTYLQLSVP